MEGGASAGGLSGKGGFFHCSNGGGAVASKWGQAFLEDIEGAAKTLLHLDFVPLCENLRREGEKRPNSASKSTLKRFTPKKGRPKGRQTQSG